MVLPTELAHLESTVVHLLFESLTERELISELGSYDALLLRRHLLTLMEHGYIIGDHAGGDPRTTRPRCLTIKGYTLLSALNKERRQEVAMRLANRWSSGGARMTGT